MKRLKLKVVVLLLAGILSSSAMTLTRIFVPKAEAQGTGPSAEWIDNTHILVHERVGAFSRDRVFTDSHDDSNHNFKDLAQAGTCQSELWLDGPNSTNGDLIVIVTDSEDNNCQLRWSAEGSSDPGEVVLCEGPDGRPLWDRRGYTNENGGDCDQSDNDHINAGRISITSPAAATINFRFTDADTIKSADGRLTFNRSQSDQNTYLRDEDGSCKDSIILDGGTQTVNGQTVRTGTYRERSDKDSGGCQVDKSSDAFVTDQADPGGGGGGAGEDDDETSCEEDGVMAWVICPVIKILGEAIDFLDSRIQVLLTVPESDYNNPQLHAVWARLRNIALLILVPIMLVMVIGTALGFDFISAYTVKRALPRLIIAAFFIIFSWTFMIFLITFTNDVGHGILGLLTSAFSNGNGQITLASLFDPSGAGGATMAAVLNGMIIGGTVAGVVYVATHAGGLLLFFAGLVVLALVVGFVVLTLRQLLILALTLVSPLAILAWIFPGNDKLWKLWWQTFSKLLLMFPLIMLLIGSGRILALVIAETRTDFADGLIGPIFKIVAWVIPYAFIFTVIKASSSLLNTLTGGVFNFQGRVREGLSSRYKERGMDQLKTQSLQRRERTQRWAQAKIDASSGKDRKGLIGRARGRAFRTAMGGVSRGVGGYNLQAAISAQRAARNKEMADQIATGDDDEIRAATADADLIKASYGGIEALRKNKNFTEGVDYKVGDDGQLQLKNISGNYYNASKAQAGYERWGDDQYALQKQLSYEMYKASSEDEVQSITDNALKYTRSHGINDSQSQGMWIGAAYENQNSKLEYKHTKLRTVTNEDGTQSQRYVLDGASFAKELYEKRGTYDMSKMSSHTIDSMATAYDQASGHALEAGARLERAQAGGDEVGARRAQNDIDAANRVQQQIRDAHATLTQRARGGAQTAAPIGQAGEEGAEQPIYGGGGMGIGAPAHVEQRLASLGDHIRPPKNMEESGNGPGGNRVPPRANGGNGNGGQQGRRAA